MKIWLTKSYPLSMLLHAVDYRPCALCLHLHRPPPKFMQNTMPAHSAGQKRDVLVSPWRQRSHRPFSSILFSGEGLVLLSLGYISCSLFRGGFGVAEPWLHILFIIQGRVWCCWALATYLVHYSKFLTVYLWLQLGLCLTQSPRIAPALSINYDPYKMNIYNYLC